MSSCIFISRWLQTCSLKSPVVGLGRVQSLWPVYKRSSVPLPGGQVRPSSLVSCTEARWETLRAARCDMPRKALLPAAREVFTFEPLANLDRSNFVQAPTPSPFANNLITVSVNEMALNWREILKSSPHELVISGPKHAKQIEDENGLSDLIFRIHSLNFMEVSKTSLNLLSNKIKGLENLAALMLYDNKLESLPKEIGLLTKLKTLDVSNNQLTGLPDEISQLTKLQSLNIVNNKVSKLPKDLSKWSNLVVIKISHNKFVKFPSALCKPTFKQHLTEILAADNMIEDIPKEIGHLSALRQLDLSNNKIEHVPGELADCAKIKTLSLQTNPIKDMRLRKMAEKNPTKQIMQYIGKSCPRGGVSNSSGDSKARKKNPSASSSDNVEPDNSTSKEAAGEGSDRTVAIRSDQLALGDLASALEPLGGACHGK